jgi:hypothetical protein
MLTIRKDQMTVLGDYMMRRFEKRMATHLEDAFPEQLKVMTPVAVMEMIRAEIAKANGYGLEYEDEIELYLEYTVIYGRDFDTNPKTSWAGEILRGDEYGPAKVRLLQEHHLEISAALR